MCVPYFFIQCTTVMVKRFVIGINIINELSVSTQPANLYSPRASYCQSNNWRIQVGILRIARHEFVRGGFFLFWQRYSNVRQNVSFLYTVIRRLRISIMTGINFYRRFNGPLDLRRIFVTGLLLINIVLFYLPDQCRPFPVSKRLLDEAVSPDNENDRPENGPLSNYFKTVGSNVNLQSRTRILHHRRHQKRVDHLKEALVSDLTLLIRLITQNDCSYLYLN